MSFGETEYSFDRTERSCLQGAELLAWANLGSNELSVYLGLRNYSTPTAIRARQELARKSLDLFLVEWKTKGHVHENYSATMDDSDTVENSDAFYHWGALIGLMEYDELK
jgi:hypothetical protein